MISSMVLQMCSAWNSNTDLHIIFSGSQILIDLPWAESQYYILY